MTRRRLGLTSARARRCPRAAWRCLAACAAAAALLQMDGTLIAVALPSVARGLRVSSASTAVLLSAYFCAYALMLIPGGGLVDRFGSRRLALVGLVVFAAGAMFGALAPNMAVLVGSRVLQGAGAGLVSPAALAGAVSGFPPARRGSALGLWGASAGVANLLGPLLGGVLTVAFGWRADWWALVPLAVLAAATIRRLMPRGSDGGVADRPSRVLNRVVVAGAVIAAVTFAVMIGGFYLAEQYLQHAVGYSALHASAVLVVVAVLAGAAAPFAGHLADRRGEQLTALLGFLAAGIGLALLGIATVSLHSGATIVLLIPVGVGLGLLFVPPSRAALNTGVPGAHGRISAVLSIGRLLGAAVGAGLAGLALTDGPRAAAVHHALLVAAALCLIVGVPCATRLRSRPATTALATITPHS